MSYPPTVVLDCGHEVFDYPRIVERHENECPGPVDNTEILLPKVILVCGISDGGKPHSKRIWEVGIEAESQVIGSLFTIKSPGGTSTVGVCPKHGPLMIQQTKLIEASRRGVAKGWKDIAVPLTERPPAGIKAPKRSAP